MVHAETVMSGYHIPVGEEMNMGLFGKLFGGKGKSTKKYEQIYFQARRMGQSVEYAFKQAVESAVADGVYASKAEGAAELYEVVKPNAEREDLPGLEKALNRMK